MKWIFLAVLALLVAWSVWAIALMPPAIVNGKTRLIWMTDDNPARREQLQGFLEQYPQYVVTLDSSGINVANVVLRCLGGNPPAFVDIYDRSMLYDHVLAGTLMPLNDVAPKMGFSFDATWPTAAGAISADIWNEETQRYERIQYAFPGNIEAPVMFYNKRLFREAGVPYPPDDWTWDQWADAARRITKRRDDGRGYERFGVYLYEYVQVVEMIWQAGGSVFDPTLTYCVLDSPEAQYALDYHYKMVVTDHCMVSPGDREAMSGQGGWAGTSLQWFARGQVGMFRVGRWALITFRQVPELRGEIGVCHVPSRYPDKKVVQLTAKVCGVNKYSPHREDGLKFLKYLASPQYSEIILRTADAMPPRPDSVEADSYLHDPYHPDETFNRFFPEAVRRGRDLEICPFIRPFVVENIFKYHAELMYHGARTPAETLRDITDEVNGRIRRNLIKYEKMREEYKRRTGRAFDPDHFPPT